MNKVRYVTTYANIILLPCLGILFEQSNIFLFLTLTMYPILVFQIYKDHGTGKRVSFADIITLARFILAALCMLLLRFVPSSGTLLVFGLLAAAAFTDLLDGAAARRFGNTEFGADLDMETDAFFFLIISLLGYIFLQLQVWVIIPGLLRYVFGIIFVFIPDPGEYPLWFLKTTKAVCAVSSALMVAAFIPGADIFVSHALFFISAVLLFVSFFIELLLRIRAARGLV
ncbi:MAG: CDP-alcohol phosphatidyltransferase family protein [Spirochaetia bacterium]